MPSTGNRVFVVAMELLMTLYALLFAFPHIPGWDVTNNTTTVFFTSQVDFEE